MAEEELNQGLEAQEKLLKEKIAEMELAKFKRNLGKGFAGKLFTRNPRKELDKEIKQEAKTFVDKKYAENPDNLDEKALEESKKEYLESMNQEAEESVYPKMQEMKEEHDKNKFSLLGIIKDVLKSLPGGEKMFQDAEQGKQILKIGAFRAGAKVGAIGLFVAGVGVKAFGTFCKLLTFGQSKTAQKISRAGNKLGHISTYINTISDGKEPKYDFNGNKISEKSKQSEKTQQEPKKKQRAHNPNEQDISVQRDDKGRHLASEMQRNFGEQQPLSSVKPSVPGAARGQSNEKGGLSR